MRRRVRVMFGYVVLLEIKEKVLARGTGEDRGGRKTQA